MITCKVCGEPVGLTPHKHPRPTRQPDPEHVCPYCGSTIRPVTCARGTDNSPETRLRVAISVHEAIFCQAVQALNKATRMLDSAAQDPVVKDSCWEDQDGDTFVVLAVSDHHAKIKYEELGQYQVDRADPFFFHKRLN